MLAFFYDYSFFKLPEFVNDKATKIIPTETGKGVPLAPLANDPKPWY